MSCPRRAGPDRSREAGSGSRVHAAVAAGIAPHFHAGERGKRGLQVLPDPYREVLQARDLEAADLVEILVIQPLAQRAAALLDFAEVGDEPGLRIDLPREHDARREGMPVQPV